MTTHHAAPDDPTPRTWGRPERGGGRAATVQTGAVFAATTSQLCGLFPFAVAAGTDVRGVPIGRHLHTAEPVGLDPAHWLRTGVVSNTGVWIQGQPGIGKSSIAKRLLTGLVGFGMRAVVPADLKGEYSSLIEQLGGTVWRIRRGGHTLNPLDLTPATTGADRDQLQETARARQLSLLEALISIVARRDPDPIERRLLSAALDHTATTTTPPTIPHLLHVLITGDHAGGITAGLDRADYQHLVRGLTAPLGLLCDGALRGLFDQPSTIRLPTDPTAVSLDLSALHDEDDDVVAAAMLCAWAWAAGFTDHAVAEGRNVIQVQDELWRALRAAPGLVERSDRITRLGRHRGVVSLQITHSLDDLDALPTDTDRAKARGLVSRNGLLILGGMADRELDGLTRITHLTAGERALVASWAAPPTWHTGRAHPGRGKYLIKSGQRIGLPVGLTLTDTETILYDTDTAFTQRTRNVS